MKDFRDLQVWRKAHDLALRIYQASRLFPTEEKYGLASELRRSARSIPSNIAEGCAKDTDREFRRYLIISLGSASELEYQLLLATDLGYLGQPSPDRLHSAVTEVKRMLSSLSQKLKADS